MLDSRIALSNTIVAPHAGAWIEICDRRGTGTLCKVAPHAGAWIEIGRQRRKMVSTYCRAPRGRVD